MLSLIRSSLRCCRLLKGFIGGDSIDFSGSPGEDLGGVVLLEAVLAPPVGDPLTLAVDGVDVAVELAPDPAGFGVRGEDGLLALAGGGCFGESFMGSHLLLPQRGQLRYRLPERSVGNLPLTHGATTTSHR